MRKQLLKTLAILSFLIAVAIMPVQSAQAQSLAYRVRANIPFDFIVGNETLPAGDYYIYRTRQYSSDNVLTISTVEGRVLAVRLTNGVQTLTPKKEGVLIFKRYGNKHFLSQVWIAGSTFGRAFLQSRSERELEREVKSIGRLNGEKVPAAMTVSVVVAGPR
jgi:hypothetical protein